MFSTLQMALAFLSGVGVVALVLILFSGSLFRIFMKDRWTELKDFIVTQHLKYLLADPDMLDKICGVRKELEKEAEKNGVSITEILQHTELVFTDDPALNGTVQGKGFK